MAREGESPIGEALGMIETRGLVAMIESADAWRRLDLVSDPAAAQGRCAPGSHPACGQAGAPSAAPAAQHPPHPRSPTPLALLHSYVHCA